MKKIIIATMVMIIAMTMPAMANTWSDGHVASYTDGDLYVDGKYVDSVSGKVDAHVTVVDMNNAISRTIASIDLGMTLMRSAITSSVGYAILVLPKDGIAYIGKYSPEEEFFGFTVYDSVEF